MFLNTRAFVLKKQKYNDKNCIVQLFTQKKGMLSFLIPLPSQGKRKKRGIYNLLYPLNEITLEFDYKEGKSLHFIKEADFHSIRMEIISDPIKSSIAFFLAEVLWRTFRKTAEDETLFEYISTTLDILELSHQGTANFHLTFLLRLLEQMGLVPHYIEAPKEENQWFDLQGLSFGSLQNLEASIPPEKAKFIPLFSRIKYPNMHLYKFTVAERREIADYLLSFYALHIEDFGRVRIQDILASLNR